MINTNTSNRKGVNMNIVSAELFERLCHPRSKTKCRQKKGDLFTTDSFTGEKMKAIPAKVFFKTFSTKDELSSKRLPPKKRAGVNSATKNAPKDNRKSLITAKEFFEPKNGTARNRVFGIRRHRTASCTTPSNS